MMLAFLARISLVPLRRTVPVVTQTLSPLIVFGQRPFVWRYTSGNGEDDKYEWKEENRTGIYVTLRCV